MVDVVKYERFPKIVYRVYERVGTRLELAGDFRFISFPDKRSALQAVKTNGVSMKCYVLLEEISVYGDVLPTN